MREHHQICKGRGVFNTKIVSFKNRCKILTNTPANLEFLETAETQSKPNPLSSRLSTTWIASRLSSQKKKIRVMYFMLVTSLPKC